MLVASETKAEVIVATARAKADPTATVTLDLDALTAAREQGPDQSESELDRLLEAAISRALDNALPPDAKL